jgi:hypothetical protein
MKVSSFFKILNKKIEKYNKMATNPFTIPQPIVLIWVEDANIAENPNLDKHF